MAADVVSTINRVGITISTIFMLVPVSGTTATAMMTVRNETACTRVASRKLRNMTKDNRMLTNAESAIGELLGRFHAG